MATFNNINVKNVDVSPLQVLTSSSDSTIILSILSANTDGVDAVDISVQRKLGATDKGYLAFTIPIPANSNFDVLGNKFILPSGDSLHVFASVSGVTDCNISYVVV
jgi:hypothetical protein